MKAKLNLILCLLMLLYLTAPLAVYGQEQSAPQLEYSHSVAIGSPTTISQDRNGNIYLLDSRRNLVVLDSLGRPMLTFSPPTRGRIASIEAWNPMKIFLFYEDRQEIFLLDRFLRPIANTQLANLENPGMVKVATISSDDGFWLFNQSDFTLNKYDTRLGQTIVTAPLNLILDKENFDVRFLREYQNMLYMLDANGIYVFDNLGNYKNKLPVQNVSYIGFKGNSLYFVKEGTLHFLDLYNLQEKTIALPATKAYVAALAGDDFIYLFSKNSMDVYTLH